MRLQNFHNGFRCSHDGTYTLQSNFRCAQHIFRDWSKILCKDPNRYHNFYQCNYVGICIYNRYIHPGMWHLKQKRILLDFIQHTTDSFTVIYTKKQMHDNKFVPNYTWAFRRKCLHWTNFKISLRTSWLSYPMNCYVLLLWFSKNQGRHVA